MNYIDSKGVENVLKPLEDKCDDKFGTGDIERKGN